jgi:hypothetical protein
MSFKIISAKEWIKRGLPTSSMTIHVGPYFEWDRERKNFKKPKLVVTRELQRKKKGDK